MKSLSLVFSALAILGLIGCSGAVDKAVLEAERSAIVAKVEAAKAQTELAFYKEADAKKVRQAEASREVGLVARQVVRTSQLTDAAGCRIAPAVLTTADHYKEFGSMMSEQYRGKCATEVTHFKAERVMAARKAVAMAKAKEQQHLATANSVHRVATVKAKK